MIARLLLESISLRGICRAMGVGLHWLWKFMVERFQEASEHLHAEPPGGTPAVILQRLEAELDELWSFMGKKANRQWVWIAMEASSRQVTRFTWGIAARPPPHAYGPTFRPRIVSRRSSTPISMRST